jgi:hypothetical protein
MPRLPFALAVELTMWLASTIMILPSGLLRQTGVHREAAFYLIGIAMFLNMNMDDDIDMGEGDTTSNWSLLHG